MKSSQKEEYFLKKKNGICAAPILVPPVPTTPHVTASVTALAPSSDQGSIVTDPLLMETAEAFSRSALSHAGAGPSDGAQPSTSADGGPSDGAPPGTSADSGPSDGAQPSTSADGGPSDGAPPGTSAGAGADGPSSTICRLVRKRAVDMSKPEPCDLCGCRYKNKASLKAHQRTYHSDSVAVKTRDSLRCAEVGCDFTTSHCKTLCKHLTQQHNIQMDVVKLIFKDWDEMTAWQSDFEYETGTRYRRLQRQVSDSGELIQLRLTCPGAEPPASQRRVGWRLRRTSGRRGRPPGPPAATRVICTSYVRACRPESDGPVTVTVNTTHYGHRLDESAAGRTKEPLPETTRRFLEETLRAGWSLERIMRAVRRSVLDDPSPLNAMFRLRRQHVYKVAHRLGIPSERLRPDPETEEGPLPALTTVAERLADNEGAHVLFHKEVGDVMEGLHESDFVFAFTTDRQLELLHQLGPGGVLMMDVTDTPPKGRRCRLLALYAFRGDGDAPRPVAWLLSSAVPGGELAQQLVLALAQLSEQQLEAPLPAPRYFVADKYSEFHQVWCEATGQRPTRLLDQARARATLSTMLIKHVKDPSRRQVVWTAVSRLMTLTGREEQPDGGGAPADEVGVRRAVYRTAAHLARQLQTRPDTQRFGAYLEEKWIRKGLLEEWQSVFRRGVVVPSHSAAQVLHAAVAAEFLGSAERCVDRAVAKLMEFSEKWNQPAPERNASAPLTMAKYFPASAGALRPSWGGPPEQRRHQLRRRLQDLLGALQDATDAELPACERAVRAMEEALSPPL
ncbi:hypothetical protein FJT64_004434 [Amphibalanus amphitrite]|uniref:C2H2-type domain-containing protein n=1 Tax=Amphibalanus amphitrite TaxID=1232801 RepID=A0A6A4VVL5_AMPAM|nr:hypothetical protein FJT64_004434 [Amphibalanus amphitrite]